MDHGIDGVILKRVMNKRRVTHITTHGGDELTGDLLNALNRLGLAITEVIENHHAMSSRRQSHSCVAADIACSAS